MKKEIGQTSVTIEHFNGSSYLSFILSVKEDGTVEVIKTDNCDIADIDGDCVFDTDNDLIRIQSNDIIHETEYEEIIDSYKNLYGEEVK